MCQKKLPDCAGITISNFAAGPLCPLQIHPVPYQSSRVGRSHAPTEQQAPKGTSGTVCVSSRNYRETKSPKEVWFTMTHPHWWQDLQKHNWQTLSHGPVSQRSLARGGATCHFGKLFSEENSPASATKPPHEQHSWSPAPLLLFFSSRFLDI